MTRIAADSRSSIHPSTSEQTKRPGVKVSASSNDPGLTASSNGRTVTLNGEATNNGKAPSVLELSFGDKTIKVPLSGGMTAWGVRDAVRKHLPEGYSLQVPTIYGRPNTRYATFEIVKDRPRNAPSRVEDAFTAAQHPKSAAGADLSRGELMRIVAQARKGGFTAAEKDAVSRSFAGLFDGARFHATESARKAFAKLQERFDLPKYYVR